MLQIIDFKQVEITKEEFKYYNQLVKSFTNGTYSGKNMFHDMFDVDLEGCITVIRPPLGKEVAWAAILFLQNLMINQRLRRMESWVRSLKDERSSTDV